MFVYISSLIAFYKTGRLTKTLQRDNGWPDGQDEWQGNREVGTLYLIWPLCKSLRVLPSARGRGITGGWGTLFLFLFLWEVPRSQRGVRRTVFGKQWRAAMCDLYRQMGRAVRDDSREGEWSGPETERVEELCFVSLRPVFVSPSRSVSLRRYIVFSVCLYFNYYSLGLLGVNIGNRPQTLLPPSEERREYKVQVAR